MGDATIVDDRVTTERVGIVVLRLARGGKGRTGEIAEWVGLTHSGAWYLLSKLSRAIPLTIVDGEWQIVNGDSVQSCQED